MDKATQNLSKYIKEKGVSLTAISKGTAIPYGALNPSISRNRPLRADEFFKICSYLEVDPAKFTPA